VTTSLELVKSENALGRGAIFGDYDNDGDLDLFIPMFGVPSGTVPRAGSTNILLRNDRGIFEDVTLEAGLTDTLPSENAIWFDFDRDGFLDLYVGQGAGIFFSGAEIQPEKRNKLYRNTGRGAFIDVTAEVGLDIRVHPFFGGSSAGIVAADFNSDGWPDLYLGVEGNLSTFGTIPTNRLFLNDQGIFIDATPQEAADPGFANGMAIGDFDNDGDLDIFQAETNVLLIGTDTRQKFRPNMLLNVGDGNFLDVTDAIGLSQLIEADIWSPLFHDIENDGDLDLIFVENTSGKISLEWFLNEGNGSFTRWPDRFPDYSVGLTASFGDFNLDGAIDFLSSRPPSGGSWKFFLNDSKQNHWLRVELVGTESNRNGIGARLIATSGDLQQMREITGGYGLYTQDEWIAHFGLGERTQVDTLKIYWPSGQMDALTHIPADQRIRVFEGMSEYTVVRPTIWSADSLIAGATTVWSATVQPALYEEDAKITKITADLSSIGGSQQVLFDDMADGTFRAESTISADSSNSVKEISFLIEQSTSQGMYWSKISPQITVLPAEDLVILEDILSEDWHVGNIRRVDSFDLAVTDVVHTGNTASFFQTEPGFASFRVPFEADVPVSPAGYQAVQFYFKSLVSTEDELAWFSVKLGPSGKRINLVREGLIDIGETTWQLVEVPVEDFEIDGSITFLEFSGNLTGVFYLDDLRIIAGRPGKQPITAVLESQAEAELPSFSLNQNFPNPFNSDTVIRFVLPVTADTELTLYNLAGQQVAMLVEGVRKAGTYTVRWDGQDDDGRELASGVYLYRLSIGDGRRVETRKLLLIR